MINNIYTLVVIDMQFAYRSARNKKTIAEVIRQIRIAKRNRCPIILVKMAYYGDTISSIRDAAGKRSVTNITKHRCDGSLDVITMAKDLNLPKKIRIVGVETGVCVSETAVGVANNRGFSVELVKAGCYSLYCNSEKEIDNLVKKNRKIKAI